MTRRFPYMFWAHTEAHASPYSLSQSGMPAPDPTVLGELALDVAPPPIEALPAFEAGLARLFGVEPERVIATMGASGAMHLASMRWFRGARVVTERPSYEPFRALPELFAADLRIVERTHDEGWRLEPARFAAALAGADGPAHAFLCNPHNPSGVAARPEELAALAEAAAGHGGVLVSDEVYMEFAPPEERLHAFALAPNGVSIGSLTKAYGLGALRLGWIVLGEGLAHEREALVDLGYLVHVDPPTPCLRAGLAALESLPALLAPVRRLEAESRPHLERFLAEDPNVEGRLGPFGLSAFPRVNEVADTAALARFLAAEEGVDVVPGEFFGSPGFVRVGFGVPEATLVEGLQRLGRGIAAFRAR